ncbi:hypothetical protein FA13DRAFT_1796281 [Coprinellus micaceus]|uniref:Uncharacterized protein n=1 Tax=Coprinellus micaceus TaxID=71717 RepID=A0A4Y7SUM5_COPMI|nr:hypothetical protein FA13DRAFT_1796281 [Coprinellus micaceus]
MSSRIESTFWRGMVEGFGRSGDDRGSRIEQERVEINGAMTGQDAGEGKERGGASTKKMVEIATQHHYSLQMLEHHEMNAEEREENKQEVLSTLETCLMPTQKDKTSGDFTNTEIERALKDVPNGKAAGLDGIPVEIWKFFLSKA